ncbi:hypothetical protein F5146DRAFT_1001458 [Armillaria mellea]|nr:hypothetical protein F5146DRAFT_1001458 [Armillaria mellea]
MAALDQKSTSPALVQLCKALKHLQDETDKKRRDISAWLAQRKAVSEEEEPWLDQSGNLVDEVVLIEGLTAAPDLNEAVQNLDEHQEIVYACLMGKIQPLVSKKRKSWTIHLFISLKVFWLHLAERHVLKKPIHSDTETTMYFTTS